MFDPYKIKQDFPILSLKHKNGKNLAFLDSAATSQKPKCVIDAIYKFYAEQNANIHRGVYQLSQEATELYEQTRQKLADFFEIPDQAKNFVFTKSATESINLVAQSFGEAFIEQGDEIVLTELEHHSNIVPWQLLAKKKKAILKYIPLKDNSNLCYEELDSIITEKTKIVALAHMSNVTGTIHDIDLVTKKARQKGAKVLIDACQSACHMPSNLKKIDCDFFAFSAHKMLGPTGVGVLYAKSEILQQIPPYMGGGDMIEFVQKESSTYAEIPSKFEAGTPNIEGVIVFAQAIDYLQKVGLEQIYHHEKKILKYALERFSELPFIKTYGTGDCKTQGGILSFNINGVHPHDVGSILDDEGVAVRSGHHCAQIYMKSLGISGTNRASFYLYNTKEDVDQLIRGIGKIKEIFYRVINR